MYDHRYDTSTKILMIKWLYNNYVTIATNNDTVKPLAKVQHWLKYTVYVRGFAIYSLIQFSFITNTCGIDHYDWLIEKLSFPAINKNNLYSRDSLIWRRWMHGSFTGCYFKGDSNAHLSVLDFKRAICVSLGNKTARMW